MKKFTAIVFALFYLLATVGITLHVHACSGEMAGINAYAKNDKCCCGDQQDNSCCTDTAFFVQLDKDQLPSQNIKISTDEYMHAIAYSVYTEVLLNSGVKTIIPVVFKILFQAKQPVWLLNCSLTYYG